MSHFERIPVLGTVALRTLSGMARNVVTYMIVIGVPHGNENLHGLPHPGGINEESLNQYDREHPDNGGKSAAHLRVESLAKNQIKRFCDSQAPSDPFSGATYDFLKVCDFGPTTRLSSTFPAA